MRKVLSRKGDVDPVKDSKRFTKGITWKYAIFAKDYVTCTAWGRNHLPNTIYNAYGNNNKKCGWNVKYVECRLGEKMEKENTDSEENKIEE